MYAIRTIPLGFHAPSGTFSFILTYLVIISHLVSAFFDAQSLNKHKLSHKTSADPISSAKGSKLFGGIG